MATSTELPTVTFASLKRSALPKPVPFTIRRFVPAEPHVTEDTADRELAGTSDASLDDTEAMEHDANTVVPNAAETGPPPPPPPAKDAPAAKVSARAHDSGSVKAHRKDLRKPYSRKDSDNARQPVAARGEVSLAAEDPIQEPKPAEEESESVSFSTPGFIPVVDFDGIPPFSDSDEIETARALPGFKPAQPFWHAQRYSTTSNKFRLKFATATRGDPVLGKTTTCGSPYVDSGRAGRDLHAYGMGLAPLRTGRTRATGSKAQQHTFIDMHRNSSMSCPYQNYANPRL
ncbi:hypothetical protein VTO73DRAFT_593 [Trametes versicolor]